MSSIERLIVQNIERSKMKESLYPSCGANTDIERQTSDLLELYEMMLEKRYHELPENTCEKRSYREIESKLIELNVIGVKKLPEVVGNDMVGEFLTKQEDTINP